MRRTPTRARKTSGPRTAKAGAPARRGRKAAMAAAAKTPVVTIGSESTRLAEGEILIVGRTANRLTYRKVRTPLRLVEIQRTITAQPPFPAPGPRRKPPVRSAPFTANERALLAEGGFDTSALTVPGADPVEIAAAEFARLRTESYTAEEAANVLGVTVGRIRQRLTSSPPTLFGIKVGGDWRVPRFQFENEQLIVGIEFVVGRLRAELNPVAVWRWFTTPNPDLPADEDGARLLTPLEWLRVGGAPEIVAALAGDL